MKCVKLHCCVKHLHYYILLLPFKAVKLGSTPSGRQVNILLDQLDCEQMKGRVKVSEADGWMLLTLIFNLLGQKSGSQCCKGYFKASLKLPLKIVQTRPHTAFDIGDQLVFYCRYSRCQTFSNSVDIGNFNYLNRSNNSVNR